EDILNGDKGSRKSAVARDRPFAAIGTEGNRQRFRRHGGPAFFRLRTQRLRDVSFMALGTQSNQPGKLLQLLPGFQQSALQLVARSTHPSTASQTVHPANRISILGLLQRMARQRVYFCLGCCSRSSMKIVTSDYLVIGFRLQRYSKHHAAFSP